MIHNGQHRPAPGGAAAIVTALASAGTRVVFGLPGGGPNLDVVGAAAAAGLRFVLTHSETAAAIMAATYADLTDAPGAVLVTRGPGLASAVNGIAHAALDRLPVIVIADTVRSAEADRISHQRLDQAALGRAVAKAAVDRRRKPGRRCGRRRGPAGARAARPGPSSPSWTTPAPARGRDRPGRPSAARAGTAAGSGADLASLARALRAARRPVVLLGHEAIAHTAAIRAALRGSGIPVLHTYRARGIMPDSEAGGRRAGHRRHDGMAAAGRRRSHPRAGRRRGGDDPGALGLPGAHDARHRGAGPARPGHLLHRGQ